MSEPATDDCPDDRTADRVDASKRTLTGPAPARRHSVDFFRGFLRNPGQVGSVIPSSRFMERRIVEYAELADAGVVVELGPGTGGTTRALLAAMAPEAKLVTIDLDPQFSAVVAGLGDARVIAHTGSAEALPDVLQAHGLDAADAVVSGIPFSTMPAPIGTSILRAVADSLSPDGVFVAYQFRAAVAALAEPVFGPPQRAGTVLLNIPPMKIWQWGKPKTPS